MKPENHIITDCNDCPFRHYNEWGPSWCNLDSEDTDLSEQVEACEQDKAKLPECCPLNGRVVTYQLKGE
jgi:hypothetical protein